MGFLGIYFGSKIISIVESAADKIIASIQIPTPSNTGLEMEDNISLASKTVGLINAELRKNNIQAKQMGVVISGKDLIIRSFDLPSSLSYRELVDDAVNMEAKKYIPFKAEDLISDFQYTLDRSLNKNLILFTALKKEVMDGYSGIIEQLSAKTLTMEYSAFSLFRLLKLSGAKTKGVIATMDVDFSEDDESNFVVFQNGFPLFSRDMTFRKEKDQLEGKEETAAEILDKIALELRVSLDFFQRKFSNKKIEKLYFLAPYEYQKEMESIVEEKGVLAKAVDVRKYMGKAIPYSSGLLKAYSISLYSKIKVETKTNFLVRSKKVQSGKSASLTSADLVSNLKINPLIVFLGLLIVGIPFGFTYKQKMELDKEIKGILGIRIQIPNINSEASYDEILAIDSSEKHRLDKISEAIKKRVLLTPQLRIIPRIVPKEMRLTDFSYQQDPNRQYGISYSFSLSGFVYLGDNGKEGQAIEKFYLDLKTNPEISKNFSKINIVSLDYVSVFSNVLASKFTIRGTN
ncbi:MAG: pilus assembly protein PilM [Candidatus Omnitrophota bacterium]|nr:pilus assembly protein PilM [Candidatus Omnitrophota bacterium]